MAGRIDRVTLAAIPLAGLMMAHQVSAKAVREATFLSAWPVSALPAMVIAAAFLVIVLAPIYSRLLANLGAHRVIAGGFFISAVAHVTEWMGPARAPWLAVLIYLHIAGLGALLLSGFWSALSERFDPQTARASYGRIGAAGTAGGVLGGLAVTRFATAANPESTTLLLLAALHAACAAGTLVLGPPHASARQARAPEPPPGWWFEPGLLARMPHLKTLGLIVVLGTASAAIADYLLKVRAVDRFETSGQLLGFFATFYLVVQVATVAVQLLAGPALRKIGLGRTMSVLPAGVTATGTLALLFPVFPAFVIVRGTESVLRSSLFRSAYELIFVPMAPAEKHRSKTLLDVTCDRLGDAVGAGVVQLALFTGAAYVSAELLAVMIGMAVVHLWLAGRLDGLYLRVVERRLRAQPGAAPIVVGSETGWTVLNLATVGGGPQRSAPARVEPTTDRDPGLRRLADLRSGERERVERALSQLSRPSPVEVAQAIQLLAWDDVVPIARTVVEASAASHLGMLTDALLDRETDFAVRRRVPRILGSVGDARAITGLVCGLDDPRFEVRFQCSRALRRALARHPQLSVEPQRILAVVERELSVPIAVWRAHRLIDRVDAEEKTAFNAGQQQNLEHVFSLLSLVVPAEPLAVAIRGLQSDDRGLRGVAIEYLSSVLPEPVWEPLQAMVDLAAADTGTAAPTPAPAEPR